MFHHPMENVGGCIARYADGKIDLLVPTNAPFRDGNEIAHFFRIPPEDVRVRVPFIGGGFGSKNIVNSHLAALFLSKKIGGRPIKLVPSAEESFKQNSRHAMLFKAKMGVKLDGTITALQVDIVVDTGAYTTGAATATHNAVISAWGCYRIPHLRIHGRCAYTNKVPAGHTRATGRCRRLGRSNVSSIASLDSWGSSRRSFEGKMFWSEASLLLEARLIWIQISWNSSTGSTQPLKVQEIFSPATRSRQNRLNLATFEAGEWLSACVMAHLEADRPMR